MSKKKTSESLAWAKQAFARLKEKQSIKYKSKLEQRVADLLTELGVSFEYESTKVPYTIQHNYHPDFVLPNHVYLETKGYWDPKDRRKVLAVKRDMNHVMNVAHLMPTRYIQMATNSVSYVIHIHPLRV